MQQMFLMLGQLLERSEHQSRDLSEIKRTMTRFDGRLRTIESRRSFRMPPFEKYFKDLLTLLIPLYTLWVTGSVSKAIEVIQAGGLR